MEEKKLSSDAYQWAYDRYIKGNPEMEKYFEELGVKADIARQLYNLRNQAVSPWSSSPSWWILRNR